MKHVSATVLQYDHDNSESHNLLQLCLGVVTSTTPKPEFKWHSYSALQKC